MTVNSPVLPVLNTIWSEQASGIEATADAATQLLQYCATYPNPSLRFYKSDMILRCHSDASYLSVSKARS